MQIHDREILALALIVAEARRAEIESNMAYVRRLLNGGSVKRGGGRPARRLSKAARERIAAAQRKRWKAFHRKVK